MKKVFVLALAALSTFALTGCEMIEGLLQNGQDLLNDKKDYSYDDYVVLLADKNFSSGRFDGLKVCLFFI